MSIKVFLSLGAGNLNSGFDRIDSRLEIDGKLVAKTQGSLPGNPELQDLHYQWQFCYAAYYESCLNLLRNQPLPQPQPARIELDSTGITGFSISTFEETTIELAKEMRQWLDNSSFRKISHQLQSGLHPAQEAIVSIESEDDLIYRLPWQYWSAIADSPQAEITFSLNTYQRQTSSSHRTKPRILAVFGDSTGIDTTIDANAIEQLQANLVTLTAPSIEELQRNLRDRQGWDILFFAGHSSDRIAGAVQLNPLESVTLTDLRSALQAAIGSGLKLAIFNCCSGLGLATSLAACNLPSAIVMREGLPNRVAHDFLQAFLHSFERGNSLVTAVAAARQRLQAIEGDFPCATWLPAVFWNPTVELPTWKSFYPQPPERVKWWQLIPIVLATTTVICGMRSQGYLEAVELSAYDLMMTTRPIEPPDDRLLIVGVNRTQPVSDRVLVQALTKLQQQQPKAIGLDIYRDIPVGAGHQDLATLLQQQNAIISPCLMAGNHKNFPGVAAPAGVMPERVGFTNFSLDRDGVVRRQVLGMAPVAAPPDRLQSGGCQTDHALSLRLALKYLDIPAADEADDGNIQIGAHKLAVLPSSVGAYRSTTAQANLRGFQVMLNYRNAAQVAPQVSLEDLLNDRVPRQSIAGKVVLVGYVGQATGDTFQPPGQMNKLPGVVIHAQMTSNILSHILDDRPLITTWSDLAEFGWISIWGTVGVVIWLKLRGDRFWIAQIGAIAIVITSCDVYLITKSVWMPVLPAGMAVILTPLVAMGVERCYPTNESSS
jgi:CHASE2 domain-containing sensor protein